MKKIYTKIKELSLDTLDQIFGGTGANAKVETETETETETSNHNQVVNQAIINAHTPDEVHLLDVTHFSTFNLHALTSTQIHEIS